jgi:hypothetical protein
MVTRIDRLARTGEGHERAKVRGVVLCRKPKQSLHQRRKALARREAGELLTISHGDYKFSHSAISRIEAQRQERMEGRPSC